MKELQFSKNISNEKLFSIINELEKQIFLKIHVLLDKKLEFFFNSIYNSTVE